MAISAASATSTSCQPSFEAVPWAPSVSVAGGVTPSSGVPVSASTLPLGLAPGGQFGHWGLMTRLCEGLWLSAGIVAVSAGSVAVSAGTVAVSAGTVAVSTGAVAVSAGTSPMVSVSAGTVAVSTGAVSVSAGTVAVSVGGTLEVSTGARLDGGGLRLAVRADADVAQVEVAAVDVGGLRVEQRVVAGDDLEVEGRRRLVEVRDRLHARVLEGRREVARVPVRAGEHEVPHDLAGTGRGLAVVALEPLAFQLVFWWAACRSVAETLAGAMSAAASNPPTASQPASLNLMCIWILFSCGGQRWTAFLDKCLPVR